MGGEVHTDGEQRPHLPIAKGASGRPAAGSKEIFILFIFDHVWKVYGGVPCAHNVSSTYVLNKSSGWRIVRSLRWLCATTWNDGKGVGTIGKVWEHLNFPRYTPRGGILGSPPRSL